MRDRVFPWMVLSLCVFGLAWFFLAAYGRGELRAERVPVIAFLLSMGFSALIDILRMRKKDFRK